MFKRSSSRLDVDPLNLHHCQRLSEVLHHCQHLISLIPWSKQQWPLVAKGQEFTYHSLFMKKYWKSWVTFIFWQVNRYSWEVIRLKNGRNSIEGARLLLLLHVYSHFLRLLWHCTCVLYLISLTYFVSAGFSSSYSHSLTLGSSEGLFCFLLTTHWGSLSL